MPPNQLGYCTMQVFMLWSSLLCSTYLLIAMTFERFYSIIRPHKAASFNTVKRAKITIACIFVFGFSFSSPYLFITTNIGRLCIPNKFASNNVLGEFYYWFSEVITFIFPFVSLLTMNSVIIHTLRQRSKQNLLGSQGQDQTEGQNAKGRSRNPEKQVIIMLLLVTFVYLGLLTPTKTVVFYLNFYSGNTPYYYASLHLFYQIGEKTYYSNHGINFFLYVTSGQKFRTDLRNLFRSKNKSLVSNINTRTSTRN